MSEIIVGNKPIANYQGYIIIQANKHVKKITLRGFGRHISKAMILSAWIRRFFPQYKLRSIEEDESKTGYVGIKITLEASKNDSEKAET